ncbi:MAG: DUF1326 domain-containing protein [Candidatus Poribacteria bacterium]|nr:DUF1326 domain-containing protein [Candidatus Poribacteria bacterium]
MKKVWTLTVVTLLITVAGAFAAQTTTVRGDYLEARSVSVYVGACHAQSEVVEGGREATLVWNIHQGEWNGVSLDNLTVVAVVTAKKNLEMDSESRRSVLYLDTETTIEQRAALVNLITTKRSAVVGEIASTKIEPIEFTKQDLKYELRVGEMLSLSALRNPCEYCTQPHEVWYKPLETIDTAVVGKSNIYRYKDTVLAVTWNRSEPSNNIFVGRFVM